MTTDELFTHLGSRIGALASFYVDQTRTAERLDQDEHRRIFFAMAFARVIIGRMILEFLQVRHDPSQGLVPKKFKGTDVWISDFNLQPIDISALSPADRSWLEKFYPASHKLVHLTNDPVFARDLDPDIDLAIPCVIKLLYQHLYKPLNRALDLPQAFVAILDREQPGWNT